MEIDHHEFQIARIALAALLITQFLTHAITLELELDGQIHDVPVDNLQLRAESDDYQHWRVSGQLPATRLAGSPLKNTVLDAQLRRDGDHLAIETLAWMRCSITRFTRIPRL